MKWSIFCPLWNKHQHHVSLPLNQNFLKIRNRFSFPINQAQALNYSCPLRYDIIFMLSYIPPATCYGKWDIGTSWTQLGILNKILINKWKIVH